MKHVLNSILVALSLGLSGLASAQDAPAPGAGPAAPPAAGGPAAPAPGPAPKPAPPPTLEQAADAVLAAVAAKDDAVLQALAAKDDPDPWLVADELVRRGQHDAAEAFAKAAPRVDTEALPAYLASRRGKPDDPARRERIVRADAALLARKHAEALELLGPTDPRPVDDVVGVRLETGRAGALAALDRLEASAEAYRVAGDAAERLGWTARACRALRESGLVRFRRSDLVGARASWERVLALCEKRGDTRGRARALRDLAVVDLKLKRYSEALGALEQALAAMETLGDKAGWASTLCNLGHLHRERGDAAKAVSCYERALAVQEEIGDAVEAARTTLGIGAAYQALGELDRALATYERVLAAQAASGDAVTSAATMNNVGLIHHARGEFEKALSMLERAHAAYEARGDKLEAASTLNGIGNVHRSLGAFAKALASYERALATQEASGDAVGAARTMVNLAAIHGALGDFAKALAFAERGHAELEARGDRVAAAAMLANIGTAHLSTGDVERALASYERALAVRTALGDKAGVAQVLYAIGGALDARGDHEEALAACERALAAFEAVGNKAGAAAALAKVGRLQSAMGNEVGALETLRRAHTAQEALGDRAAAAWTLGNIGWIQHRTGDTLEAIKTLERVARTSEKIGSVPLIVGSLRALAAARLKAGDAGRALSDAHRAVLLLKTLVGGLGEEQGAAARGRYTDLFATGLAAAAELDDPSEAAFFLESGRAGTMLESLDARDALRRAALPEPLRVAEATARAGEVRARAAYTKALAGDDLAAVRASDEALKAAQARVHEVVERIQREAKREARLWYPVASPVEDIQGFLEPGDALVLYGLARDDDPAHALVLTREAARIVPLGATSALLAACEAFDASDPSLDPAAALARLRELLVGPLSLPEGTRRLLVSPEGPLSYLPFAALAPALVVAYQPSGTTYGVLLEEREKRGSQVLALADPDYATDYAPIPLELYAPQALAATGTTRGRRLVPLPATRAEATAVADVKRFGKDASEAGLHAALAERSGRWRAVHLACHGLVNPDRPTLSSLALTPDGANDGFLTALEVLRMEIPSDLVVLSACETGKGKILGGEGIVGLSRAFMYAGSPRVICSLWKVDDEATSALMRKFYDLWNPKTGSTGLGTAEALRQAQEHVRSQAKWKHPYYWAAWVLWGLPS